MQTPVSPLRENTNMLVVETTGHSLDAWYALASSVMADILSIFPPFLVLAAELTNTDLNGSEIHGRGSNAGPLSALKPLPFRSKDLCSWVTVYDRLE